MASVNKVILVGNLGRDPEVRYTPDGMAVCNVSLATKSQWKDKNGNRQEDTEWHRVVLYHRLAEIAGEYLRKGRSVYVEGRLKTRKWKDRATGQDRYSTEVVGEQMQMLGGAAEPRGDAAREPAPAASAAVPTGGGGAAAMDDDIPFAARGAGGGGRLSEGAMRLHIDHECANSPRLQRLLAQASERLGERRPVGGEVRLRCPLPTGYQPRMNPHATELQARISLNGYLFEIAEVSHGISGGWMASCIPGRLYTLFLATWLAAGRPVQLELFP